MKEGETRRDDEKERSVSLKTHLEIHRQPDDHVQ